MLGYDANAAEQYFPQGIEFVAIAGDAWLLAREMNALAARFAR